MNPKIIELIIQDGDDDAGLDGIALVELPAHEANFEYFNEEKIETPCSNGDCEHYVLCEEEIPDVIKMFNTYGEPQGLLEQEGWYISKVEDIGREEFTNIIANPNIESEEDSRRRRIRYKYVGPRDEKNRIFCADMMSARRVFRREDIDEMSRLDVNPVGPSGYSIFRWRGSYNCRHKWVKLTYEPTGRIINNDKVDSLVVREKDGTKGDTRNKATRRAGRQGTPDQRQRDSEPRKGGFSSTNPDVSALSPYVDQITKPKKKPVLNSLPLFEKQEDAEAMAEAIGCKGSHEHKMGDKTMYMPCSEHPKDETSYEIDDDYLNEGDVNPMMEYGLEEACWPGYEAIGTKIDENGREVPNCVPEKMAEEMMKQEFQSYDDYPESARNNACKALRWREEYGDEVQGMTRVGWIRANQLCKGEKISEETIARMSGFQRHRQNSEVAPEYKDTPWKDKGYVAWLGWGGTTGVEWASNKLKSIRNEMTFSVMNNDERIVVGAAMIPNKMIIRRNEITGEIYYVYFTEKTIKSLQQKYMLEKLLDKTNIEHSKKFLNGVSIVESWIVEDQEKDKQQVFGMNYPKGTWMIMMKVEDDKVWEQVKNGKLRGFSVQGYFIEKAAFSQRENLIEEIKNILKEVI